MLARKPFCFLLSLLAALAGSWVVHAQSIYDLDILVELAQDGSARITQE